MNINTILIPSTGFTTSDVAVVLGIVFALLYGIFALIILRQVQLMTKTLPSPISPVLVFISIVHIGVVIAILAILIGFL